ncbi:hypothetical protein TNIN_901 [Trichonephila inaurata madagascariensis]|uniref:Uncharacterized protein n=1 Tax=Trichonephila inaurata madagascariensis TaxID=2747483 RepID=A0A8X6YY22_9ARAC|nr:hypothetical protein TNIN_901 [Trichonephila inaurata madagascariensis]
MRLSSLAMCRTKNRRYKILKGREERKFRKRAGPPTCSHGDNHLFLESIEEKGMLMLIWNDIDYLNEANMNANLRLGID